MSEKRKSLGVMFGPVFGIESCDCGRASVTVVVTSAKKKLRIEAHPEELVNRLVALAQEITAKQREYATHVSARYRRMKTTSGFKPPAGEE